MYGEGVYEVLRTYNGEPFLYDQHIARLRRSAAAIHLDLPFDDAHAAIVGGSDVCGRGGSRATPTSASC